MERIEELLLGGLKIYQDDELYHFTSDSVLLTRFAKVKANDVVADFCSGSGIVGLHLYALNPSIKNVTLFEMQPELFNLSKKSIELNNLSEKFFAVNTRLQDISNEYNEKFSLIVCNPPYMPKTAGLVNENEKIAMCRSELTLNVKELIYAVSRCLKFGGRVCLVHRAERLTDVMVEMRNRNIEPKRIQFVSGKNKTPYLVMIEGVKGGKSGVKVENTVIN